MTTTQPDHVSRRQMQRVLGSTATGFLGSMGDQVLAHQAALQQIDRTLAAWSDNELAVLRRGLWGRLRWIVTGH